MRRIDLVDPGDHSAADVHGIGEARTLEDCEGLGRTRTRLAVQHNLRVLRQLPDRISVEKFALGDQDRAGDLVDLILVGFAYVDKDGKSVAARESKLNSAFFEGGPALLIETVEGLTGLSIDRYVQVDFDGFQTIVNRLDGVEVCLAEPAKEKDSGIDLPAGRQTIKGDQALAFVRQRKGLPNGDIDRIRRQQQFIGGIVRKVLSAGTLANPLRLNGVIDAATESLKVDDGRARDADPNVNIIIREPGHVEFAATLGLGTYDLARIKVQNVTV